MPGPIIRPDLQPLTAQLRNYLISQCNTQPLDVIMHYLQTGEITLAELTGLTSQRRTALEQKYQEWLATPDPAEAEAWKKIEALRTDVFSDREELEKKVRDFISAYPKSSYIPEAKRILAEIAQSRWTTAAAAPQADLGQMETKLGLMTDTLAKYRSELSPQLISQAEDAIAELKMQIAREKLKPLFDEWDTIKGLSEETLPDILRKEQKMQDFLNKNSAKFPDDVFRSMKAELKELQGRIDYKKVEPIRFNFEELIKFIRNQTPGSDLFGKADGYLWDLLTAELDSRRLQRFIKLVPNSAHHQEARLLLDDLDEWLTIKGMNDNIFNVHEYINTHPNVHPAILEDASNTLAELKEAELQAMVENPSAYERRKLFGLINGDIIRLNELINLDLTTEESFKNAKNRDAFIKNNPIDVTFKPSTLLDADDITDVYLFGVPSTGKTCVLMGLLGTPMYDWNNMIAAGDYGIILSTYRDNRTLPDRTLNSQFFCIHGKAKDRNGNTHLVNVIELAGEQFLDKIALNPVGKVSLVDMDAIAAQSFKNKNRKIFFIVIDPTVKYITYKKEVDQMNPDGTTQKVTKVYTVAQKIIIKRIMDILRDPANVEMMKKVDALHFIATKADVIEHKNQNVRDYIIPDYIDSINAAAELSQPQNAHINEATGFKPKLYTFSLGKFYVGGTFEYDKTDSEKLINVITENTLGVRDRGFLEKVLDILNIKLF